MYDCLLIGLSLPLRLVLLLLLLLHLGLNRRHKILRGVASGLLALLGLALQSAESTLNRSQYLRLDALGKVGRSGIRPVRRYSRLLSLCIVSKVHVHGERGTYWRRSVGVALLHLLERGPASNVSSAHHRCCAHIRVVVLRPYAGCVSLCVRVSQHGKKERTPGVRSSSLRASSACVGAR